MLCLKSRFWLWLASHVYLMSSHVDFETLTFALNASFSKPTVLFYSIAFAAEAHCIISIPQSNVLEQIYTGKLMSSTKN